MASIGLEYNYNQQFFVRGGYYYENKYQGNRQYFSVGAGFRMSVFQLDAAYLISTVQSLSLIHIFSSKILIASFFVIIEVFV